MLASRDTRVAAMCVGGVVVMTGLAFAAVPLYKLYCQVTGFGGTTQRVDKASGTVLDRQIDIRFDANVSRDIAWTFEPVQQTMHVKIGENALAFYRATNTSAVAVTGTAMFNVSPDVAGVHFNKIECFCFKEQTLAPGETVDMPVSFYVDPAIVSDRDAAHLKEITLSYTFYPSEPASGTGGATPGEPAKGAALTSPIQGRGS
ncbi:MAG: cytochrome c oxidase assembly protein [Hyphomicrobium sp.]